LELSYSGDNLAWKVTGVDPGTCITINSLWRQGSLASLAALAVVVFLPRLGTELKYTYFASLMCPDYESI
jgi:hypothetical protein